MQLSENSTILSVEIDAIMETEEMMLNVTTSTETDLKVYLNSLTPSKEIKVAILDTGIDTSKFDNIIDLGINLSSSGEENSILDDNGHGTEMATIITSNSNDYVKLMPIKIANSDGKATVLNTYLGIKKAIENETDVINISMNTIKSNTSHILEDAINEASDKGIIVVVSAGNNSMDIKDVTPSYIESAIVVSAVDKNNNFASYSNYGETVDYCSYGTYGDKTGTSYAAANVTSVIADALSKNESASILDQYLIDLGDTGKDIYYGNGLIQVNSIEAIYPQLPNETENDTSETENNTSETENDDSDEDIHIMTKEECERDEFWQKYHTDIVVENILDYSNDELSVSSVETLTINPNGGSANHIDGSYITSSTAKSLGSLIGIGETKSFSTETQTIDFNGTYHFIVVGGAGGSATLKNSDGSIAKTASGGNGVKITSNAVSINSGTKLTFKNGATSSNVSKTVLSVGSAVNKSNHFANGGSDVYKLNGSSYNTSNWYQAVFGDGGNYSSVSFSGHKIVAAGGGGGAVLYYNISGAPKKWTSKKNLNGKSVPLSTADNTSQKSGYDYEKKYVENYGGSFASGSGLWDTGSNQYSAGKGYKNGQFGGYGSDAVAGGSCGQNYVSGFVATYDAHTENSSYVKMACDSKTFTVNDPVRTGYTFTGWSVAGTGVSQIDNGTSTTFTKSSAGNMTLTANWSINSYTITCYDYLTDGTYLGSPGSTTRNYGASISGSEWGTSSPYNNAQYTYYYHSCTTVNPITGNCSVNRYWTRSTNAYTQTNNFYYYHPVNGWIWFNAKSSSQLYGTWYTSTNAGITTPTGYHWSHFNSNGWTVTGNKNDGDGNGHYLPNTYTIVYNGNGNTGGSTASTAHTYDLAANLRTNGFTKTGYSFTGWATSPNGNVAYGNNASVINLTATHNATINLYAKWNINQYTVTYIDVVDSTSGKQLGKTTKKFNYGTAIKGSDLGSDTSDNKYYKGYYYVSDTTATVTENGATVYRIFKLRTSTINGNIIWEDWNNKNLSRPDNVTLHIIGSDGNTYDFEISGDNSKNTNINTWPYSKAVPKYDSNGNVVTYTVGQDKAISKEDGLAYKAPIINGYDVTNIISSNPDEVPVLPEISVTTSIEWIDNDNQYGYRPNEIIIQLLQNGVVIDEVTTSDNEYTFDKLYKYDEVGDLYIYEISSNNVDRYNNSINNKNYKITYTFQAPTFSVIIPKTVIIDGKTGIGEYAVSVQGNIDDRDFVNVIPDSSFTMENEYLSPITATVKQTITSFTNKNNIKDGTTAIGIINTNSLAGEWSGSFNFNIYFEFGE